MRYSPFFLICFFAFVCYGDQTSSSENDLALKAVSGDESLSNDTEISAEGVVEDTITPSETSSEDATASSESMGDSEAEVPIADSPKSPSEETETPPIPKAEDMVAQLQAELRRDPIKILFDMERKNIKEFRCAGMTKVARCFEGSINEAEERWCLQNNYNVNQKTTELAIQAIQTIVPFLSEEVQAFIQRENVGPVGIMQIGIGEEKVAEENNEVVRVANQYKEDMIACNDGESTQFAQCRKEATFKVLKIQESRACSDSS